MKINENVTVKDLKNIPSYMLYVALLENLGLPRNDSEVRYEIEGCSVVTYANVGSYKQPKYEVVNRQYLDAENIELLKTLTNGYLPDMLKKLKKHDLQNELKREDEKLYEIQKRKKRTSNIHTRIGRRI